MLHTCNSMIGVTSVDNSSKFGLCGGLYNFLAIRSRDRDAIVEKSHFLIQMSVVLCLMDLTNLYQPLTSQEKVQQISGDGEEC